MQTGVATFILAGPLTLRPANQRQEGCSETQKMRDGFDGVTLQFASVYTSVTALHISPLNFRPLSLSLHVFCSGTKGWPTLVSCPATLI